MLDWLLPGKSRMVILKKVLVDQVIASPTLILGFFIGMNTLEGKQFKQCIEEIKEKFLVLYMVDCAFWPPVQTINFYFLPPQLRVVYVSCAVLVWDVFLAYYKHMDQEFDCTSKSKQHSTV